MTEDKVKKIVLTLALVLVVGTGLWAVTKGNKSTARGSGLRVTTSFYPLYEFTKQVGGDKVQVTNMTPAGAEPHDFEPSAKAIAEAQNAAVFIYNGGIFEPWAAKFTADYHGMAVKGSQGIALLHSPSAEDEHGSSDPHYWLDPLRAQQVVNTIRDSLSKADPAHADYYARNARAYNQKLEQLDSEFSAGLQNCDQRIIVVSHQSMGYLGARYNFAIEAVAGLNPEREPSAARLAELTQIVREKQIGYIFFESLVSPRLAATIASETGAQTSVLDPIEGLTDAAQQAGKNYLTIQRENLRNLRHALACR